MVANPWSDLNADVLDCIIHKLDIVEYFCFSATCRSWHSSAQIHSNHCPMCPKALAPWLLFSSNDSINDESIKPYLSFYDVNSTKHNIHVDSILSNIKAVFGSSNGFLVVFDSAHDIHIINPISKTRYPLPRMEDFDHPDFHPELSYDKAVIDISTTSNQTFSVALLCCGGMIMFVSSDDTSWNELRHTGIDKYGNTLDEDIIYDVVFYKGGLYLMCQSDTYVIDLKTHFETCTNLHLDRREERWNFLVKSPNDDLFLVTKYAEYMRVYKFNDTHIRWDRVKDLGEFALFVGSNSFFFLPNSNCSINVTKNNICFMIYDDDFSVGVFDLVDGTVKLFEIQIDFEWSEFSQAFWFTPTLG